MAVGNANFDTALLTLTLETFLKTQPMDVIFEDNAIFDSLKARDKVTKQGGVTIDVPLMYGMNTAVGSFSGYDTLDISPQEGFTRAVYDWKQYFGTLSISGREQEINSGKPAVASLLKSKWEQLRGSLNDLMNADFFGDGTGNSSKDVLGLAILVDSTGTLANIVRTDNTWWRAQETAVSGVLTIDGSTGLRRLYNDCGLGKGTKNPNLIITTQAIYEAYEQLMAPYLRYTVQGEANAVFKNDNLMFRKAPMFWDHDCTSQTVYVCNTDFLELVTMEGQDFKTHPFQTPINQDSQVAKITWMGNFVCTNCRHQGKLTGVTN